MKDHKLYMEECKINSIEEVDDKYYIKVTMTAESPPVKYPFPETTTQLLPFSLQICSS